MPSPLGPGRNEAIDRGVAMSSRLRRAVSTPHVASIRPAPEGVKQATDGERTEYVADRERYEIQPDFAVVDAVERRQDQRVREEDGVVQERLSHHQRKAEQRPLPVLRKHHACDLAEAD